MNIVNAFLIDGLVIPAPYVGKLRADNSLDVLAIAASPQSPITSPGDAAPGRKVPQPLSAYVKSGIPQALYLPVD